MNFLVLIVFVACFSASQQAPQIMVFDESDAIVKRQASSYSSNVIHKNPKYPDGQAESSVQFEFHASPQVKTEEQPQIHHQADQEYAYTRQKQQTQPHYSAQKQVSHLQQTPKYNSQQSQAINVGYSVSFAGPTKPETSKKYTKQSYENSDIITGYRKEVVQQPNDFQPKDFVNHALDLKKQRISGLKPKTNVYAPTHYNDGKNFINNLSPKTIEHLSKLGVSKPNEVIQPEHIKIHQSSDDAESVTPNWVNLTPYVELYRSEEKQQTQNYKDQIKPSLASMFGKPQVFDFTNVLETTQRAPRLQEDSERRPSGRSEKPQPSFQIKTYDEGMEHLGQFIKPLPLIQMPSVPQYGVDTSLLRNAGLNMAPQMSPNLIAVPLDTSLLEAMQTKIMESFQQNRNLAPRENLFQPATNQHQYQPQQSQKVQHVQEYQKPKKPGQQQYQEEPQSQNPKPTYAEYKFKRPQMIDSYLPQTFYDNQFDNVKGEESTKYESVANKQLSRQRLIKAITTDLQPPPESTRRRRLIITL